MPLLQPLHQPNPAGPLSEPGVIPVRSCRSRFKETGRGAFTLIEVLASITVIGLLVGLTAVTVLGFRAPGGRQGAMLQLSSAIEEARMSAIESRSTIYLGLAGASHPDADKRMHAYILFREPTAEELASMATAPAPGTYRAITEWQSLPKGFYWDLGPTGSVAADSTAELDTHGVAGPSSKLHVIAFGPLGSVERPATAPLVLAVTPVSSMKQPARLPARRPTPLHHSCFRSTGSPAG